MKDSRQPHFQEIETMVFDWATRRCMKRPWNHWDQDNCNEVTGRARASHKNITGFAGDSKSGRSDLVGEIHSIQSYNLSSNYWWSCWFCVHLPVPQSQSVPMPSWVLCHGCVNEDSLENAAVLQDCLWAWWLRNLHSLNLTTSRSQLTSVQAVWGVCDETFWAFEPHLNHTWTILWWYYLIRCYSIPNSARGRSCEAVPFFQAFQWGVPVLPVRRVGVRTSKQLL